MPDKHDFWKTIFEDDLDDAGVPPVEEPVEDADTFQIDEAFFASEADYQLIRPTSPSDTNVIPPEVRDVSAYTNGHSAAASNGDEEGDGFHFDQSVFDMEDREDDEDYGDGYEDGDEYGDDAYEDDEDGESRRDEDYDEDDDPEKGEEPTIQFARRRRTGLMGGFMYAAVIVSVSIILASLAWMIADDVLALTKEETLVEIIIPEGFTIDDVADALYATGAINYRQLFTWFVGFTGVEDRIQPGQYQLIVSDYRAIINGLNQRAGQLIEQRVMIPEGRMMREIFQILEYNGVATVEALEEAAAGDHFDFPFLDDVPIGTMNRLEGYLFPDTYVFYLRQDPVRVINRMLQNFNTRMLQNDIYDLVEESEFTLHEIVNIASMIEGEMASVEEAPRISSVIHNRIRQGMHINIDATIQYILPERVEFLTTIGPNAHTAIDSPYNTYLHTGLPYGPISNPGVAAILAALNPEQTNFLFYALHVDGHHHFTRNYDEHRAFIATPNFAHYSGGS